MFNSVVKEICFEQQQDVITTSVVWILLLGTSLTTILILSASFPFKVNPKKLLGQDCLKMGKKVFTVFWCKKLRLKISKWQLFLSSYHPPLF